MPEEAKDNDLADRLFKLPWIMKIELIDNVVLVTQGGAEDWRQLGKRVGSAIRAFFSPVPEVAEGDKLPPEHVRTRVQQVLDEMINPGVAAHGGFDCWMSRKTTCSYEWAAVARAVGPPM